VQRAGQLPRSESLALAAALVTVVLWASAFVGIRSAGRFLSPEALALGRLLVSSAVLGSLALVRREALPMRSDLGLIALLAGVLLREGFPAGLFAGCIVAFAGTAIIGVATSQHGVAAGWGAGLCIVAAFAYAAAVVVQKPVVGRVSAFQVTWIACTVATIACLPFAPALVHDLAGADGASIAWPVYLGAFPTAVGFVLWAYALKRTPAGRLGSLTYLAPPIAILLGWGLLGETPPLLALAGGALCLGGVILARR